MKKNVLAILVLTIMSAGFVFSQENVYKGSDRYIVIDNIDDFFIEKDDMVEVSPFYIRNFDEELSSKPVHLAVNEIPDVIRFGIASSSEQFERQRRCYIRLEKSNFEMTFYKALSGMEVNVVVLNGEIYTAEGFYDELMKK